VWLMLNIVSRTRYGSFILLICSLPAFGCGQNETEIGAFSYYPQYHDITVEELKKMMDAGEALTLIDVRTYREYISGHLPGAVSIPYRQIASRSDEIPHDQKLVVYCQTGLTSSLAVKQLAGMGFTNLYNIDGGMAGWEYSIELNRKRKII
jgi:rhodanese-related sulfurtransferase